MTTGSTSSHGATFNKGPAACQTCHGATLTGGVKSCETCHPGWKTNCTFCHGGKDNQTGAPPLGVDGETLTSQLAVGAHTEHVTASANKAAFACSTCHTVPADALSAGHVDGDGKAETKPSACGLQGTYAAAGTCSSVYCHGNGKSTTTGGTATWTGAALTCQSCHPQAGLTTRHAIHLGMGFTCNLCHGDTVAANGTISNPAKHGNCTRDVKGTFTYAPATKTCSNVGCHGTKTW
jgi:predicted CxxxxCH...CXXCH cytochrome family protein